MLQWALAALLASGLALAQVEARFVFYEHLLVDGELREYVGTQVFPVTTEDELRMLVKRLSRPPKNARFVYQKNRGWYGVEKVGYRIELGKALAAYRRALAYGRRGFYLPEVVVPPKRSLADLYRRGIRELVGEGVTDFGGSSKNRIWNLRLAARKLDGRIIPRGGTFSFLEALGPVDEKTGYREGYVILGDRTEKGVGGGVCQVSTTVFRAAFFAGLPILERHPHSYQLRYYRPSGLDATVYGPWIDLKFKNDTPGDLLLRTYIRGTRLFVRLFGTRDRSVVWQGPAFLETTPPLPPREIEDPTLPPGTRKQVDWPAPGARVEVIRTVRYNDGREVRETFTSVYKPWGAIYLVGPPANPPEAQR